MINNGTYLDRGSCSRRVTSTGGRIALIPNGISMASLLGVEKLLSRQYCAGAVHESLLPRDRAQAVP